MIKEPINLSTKFHSEVIQIVVDCSDKVHWKKLARRLDMQHNWIENIEHDHKSEPIGEQCYQMLVDWNRRTGCAANLEKLLSALTGMKCFEAVQFVAKRITEEVEILRKWDNSKDQPPSDSFKTDLLPV